jgi:3-hydroxybutyrate dehydrogenase/3-oxoacyl-[acyl-carrier protein] reductase
MGQMDGRVAAITSGSTGIGHGIAKAFLAEGASVVINGRDAEKGARALDEISAGERGHFVAGDVTVRENVDAIIDGTVERFGRIDILVNNAGGLIKTAPVADLSDEDWDYAIKWNLYSMFWASRKALGYMLPQRWGRIISISSVEGKHGKPAIPAYVTSKHAMNGLTKAIAKEVGTSGVTCNSICPGLVWTTSCSKPDRTVRRQWASPSRKWSTSSPKRPPPNGSPPSRRSRLSRCCSPPTPEPASPARCTTSTAAPPPGE